jgi:hypothetical protein
MTESGWVEIGHYSGQFDADLDREALEEAGITVMVKGSLTGAFGPGYVGWTPEGLRLFVPAESAAQARDILEGGPATDDDAAAADFADDDYDSDSDFGEDGDDSGA